MHKNLFNIVVYTTTYKNVKTYTDFGDKKYDDEVDAYRIVNLDSHTTENIFEKNDKKYVMYDLKENSRNLKVDDSTNTQVYHDDNKLKEKQKNTNLKKNEIKIMLKKQL